MKAARWMAMAVLLGMMAPQSRAQAPAAKGFDAFALVKTRNVFDPNRRSMRSDPSAESRAASSRSRPSYFTLTGTMVADGRTLAFFSGSRADFSKVIPAGEIVAGYKVLTITPVQVELEHEGKSLVMAVGHRLQLDGLTDEVSAAEAAAPSSSGPTPGPADPSAPVAPPGAPAPPGGIAPASNDKAEILRRMMERRQKEISK